MNEGEQIAHRVERAVFETDRQLIVGDVTLPPEGYQSRFSDSLNRGDVDFVPLTNAEITSLADGKVERAAVHGRSPSASPDRLPVDASARRSRGSGAARRARPRLA